MKLRIFDIKLSLLATLCGGVLTFFLAGCPSGQSGISGELQFDHQPLAGASVEIYLRAGKDRSTLPFATVDTDDQGRYRFDLPAGQYYVIGKLRQTLDDGRTRMLMAECPTNPVDVGAGIRVLPAFSLREMGRDGALMPLPGTGVEGRLTAAGEPVAGAYVYVYTEAESGLMGPSYGEAVKTAADGRFHIELPAGRFYLAARKRGDGGRMGGLAIGDLNGTWAKNPINVTAGEMISINDFPLQPVDAAVRAERLASGTFKATGTGFAGRVVNQDQRPVAGIYVFAYLDSRMVGKPTYISAPTANDGSFNLFLGSSGTYYIGARSTFGGPLEPGEWVGTWDGQADHGAAIVDGNSRSLGDIIVREVW